MNSSLSAISDNTHTDRKARLIETGFICICWLGKTKSEESKYDKFGHLFFLKLKLSALDAVCVQFNSLSQNKLQCILRT